MADKYLSVHVLRLQLRNLRLVQDEYLSFLWRETFYFTRSYCNSGPDSYSVRIEQTLVLPVEQAVPASLLLQNWHNNMILLQHEVDVSELQTRNSCRKKHEIRQGEILEFTVHVLSPQEFILNSRLIPEISQHYLIIHQIGINDTERSVDVGPSYFQVICEQGKTIVPVTNSIVNVALPNWLEFQHVKNGKLRAQSRRVEWD
jgi:hypothetical protein